MKIKRIPVGVYAANCYIVMDEDTKEGIVIDPGSEALVIEEQIKKMGVNVKYIFVTHGHIDHTGAVAELKKALNAPVCISEQDDNFIVNRAYMFGNPENCGKADIIIREGDIFNIGNMKLKCIETPGHTLGGMCFIIDNIVFTGDTLFEGSIGRTDFDGGDFETIINSIKTKLITLSEDTIVLPGHGDQTTIKNEKVYNPFL
ncbi:glyoxylase-like metal-dependent hydrolase (beta-lactamase superfamily II) [Clostridium tetanomorphum]|uniref:MBL fold metallo-hydrolase n=1 Tax=Clostridium tetanomorphum TaxID=1553 RepID=A0A923E6C5_CLOTT|nr:MBL fold metallo-hydrolase [Clostridium tetanomorphum]KAJ49451.1 hydroxyacylglutathione hydrolase [Clostridium tetanomorphum DSM 665]KAJ53688.1 hydroxyacylglutathione hydrolase [Clostridium tetanomorphum DSM 665]MBC2397198.1 MBL fold metallo-hydrolase [Clostridium tetanomorphum]MBP1862412.1 glyoxylase-like metal-dependent hydrolase (beta-lactamase superfamily II) [Clostridium tetanomorphum]NRS85748.1 glyoxylase-like metal-dependent hydrolase (beta-lactamase superfamily II) [Clostridium teta